MSSYREEMKLKYDRYSDGQYREICPACSAQRKPHNQREKCLSVRVEWPTVKWMCHHCAEAGGVSMEEQQKAVVKFKPPAAQKDIAPEALAYLVEERGLSPSTLAAARIMSDVKYIRKEGREMLCAGFPYINDEDQVYAIKWRALEKKAWTQDGAARSFWGIEHVRTDEPLIIVEGELDVLSLKEANIRNSVSVPNGAPIKVKQGQADPREDRKFSFVWEADDVLSKIERVYIGVDRDGAGAALAEELARRIGKIKCYQIDWPEDCKDANDTLLKHGKAEVSNCVNAAKPWPISGLFSVDHYKAKVEEIYNSGVGRGLSTGLATIDELFTIQPPLLYIVTGIPSMGKSEFVDQILMNLSRLHDLKHAICSFENPPHMHLAKIIQRIVAKSFYKSAADEVGFKERMSKEEMNRALEYANDHFIFLENSDGQAATIDTVLERATVAVKRKGCRTLTIDPYNYLDLNVGSKSETALISEMLTKVRNWASANECCVFFVAHPAKLYRNSDGSFPVPLGHDISGSASWYSKSDVGLSVHRNMDTNSVEIHVWKVRWRHIGKQGMAELKYDIPTGTYEEEETDWEEIQESL